jgi:polygalacturonase
MTDRRDFLKTLAVGIGGALVVPNLTACRRRDIDFSGAGSTPGLDTMVSGWASVPGILARIKAPTFPDRTFDVTRHGAVGDGRTDCTAAFRAAIEACSKAGGGRVTVPAGRFLTGPIHLKSNVDLHVTKEATLAFTTDTKAYLPAVLTRFEGMELMGYSPLIYALEQENIAVSGEGTLDGQAAEENWWRWKGGAGRSGGTQVPARARLGQMVAQGVPVAQRVFGEGDFLRPQFIQPYKCRNVLIEGVRIVNSPMWEVHPVLCTNVTVRRVHIATHGPNNDGCDPESCRDVLIEDCYFDTGDDCIAIKSGRNEDGRRVNVPTENVIIRGCQMKDGHGGVTIGSEISGGVRNVFVEKCTMDSPNLDRALRFKNNAARGGTLEHIYMRDVTVGQVADAVLSIDFYYEEGQKGTFVPVVRDVEMRNVTSRKSNYGVYARAYEKSEISNLRFIDCTFDGVAKGNVVERVTGVSVQNFRVNGQPVADLGTAR